MIAPLRLWLPGVRAACAPLLAIAAVAPLSGQQLHIGVARADHVVLARQVGVQPLGKGLLLHRFETVEAFGEGAPQRFSIPIATEISDQPRPAPTSVRLCCLRDRRDNGDLPERFGPYFDLTGYRGDHVAVDDEADRTGVRELVDVLRRAAEGRRPADSAGDLARLVLRGTGPARREAAEVLRSRTVLRDALSRLEQDSLLTLAVGETEDVDLKVSVASLAVECNGETALAAVVPALRTCHDPSYALALGRLARFVHGTEADDAIAPMVGTLRGPARDAGLIAIGATRTDGALERLEAIRERDGSSDALIAALRAHGSTAALKMAEADAKERKR